MAGVLEDSVESFIIQWKPYAARVRLFSRVEGSPLLECQAAGVIMQLFERTSPYGTAPGDATVIIHPVAERAGRAAENSRRLEVLGPSRLRARGLVLSKERHMSVIDVGVPLVVGFLTDAPMDVALGDWLEFDSLAPVHGFVVPASRRETDRVGGDDSL